MKTDDNDRIADRRTKAVDKTPKIVGITLISAVVGIGAYFYFDDDEQPPAPVVTGELPVLMPQVEDEVINDAPDIPLVQGSRTATDNTMQSAASDLPDLAESDEFTRGLLGPLSDDTALARWLSSDNLLQKAVAVVDGLARGVVLSRFIPGPPPEGTFPVVTEQGVIRLDEAGYARFDHYTNAIISIPPQSLASTFHTLRPLLERAYGDLGGQPEAIDNRVIAAIDRMLATPDHNGPFVLTRNGALYRFADPGLEALPEVQKQLLRAGPENRAKLLDYLQTLRRALLAGEDIGGD